MEMDELLQKAKFAQVAERYDDMAAAMKSIIETNSELSNEERELFSIAFRNIVDSRRSSLNCLRVVGETIKETEPKKVILKEYSKNITKEHSDTCYDVLGLLDKYLIPSATNLENEVFYLKLKGDYYRYIAEVATGDQRTCVVKEAEKAYHDAFDICKKMEPTHPIRLGLVLNFSVFYYEILSSPKDACRLARQAFEEAVDNLDSLNEDTYQDSQLIMEMLGDNLLLWNFQIDEPVASGQEATTSGQGATTSGQGATTSGQDATTSGQDATTSGQGTTSGQEATTAGQGATTSGQEATAAGQEDAAAAN